MASTQSAPMMAPTNGATPGQVNPLQNLNGDQVKEILQVSHCHPSTLTPPNHSMQ